jgi:hypothetical protein
MLQRISAIQALSTGTIADVANLVTIVIGGYGFSHMSPRLVALANKSFSTCNYCGESRPPYGGHSPSNRTAIVGTFCGQCADDNFILERACRDASRLSLGHSFGTSPARDDNPLCVHDLTVSHNPATETGGVSPPKLRSTTLTQEASRLMGCKTLG